MKDWERTLITPDTILRDALDVIDKAGSQIALVVDADRYLLDKLIEGCSAPPSYSSRARFQTPPRVASRLVKPGSNSCMNSPISKNNHGANKL